MDINKVTLIGRLTAKPEPRKVPSGQSLTSFSVATNYVWMDAKTREKKNSTEYHDVLAWGKLAEIAATYLDKGSRVYLEGRLQRRETRGTKERTRQTTTIVADEIIMLGGARREVVAEAD